MVARRSFSAAKRFASQRLAGCVLYSLCLGVLVCGVLGWLFAVLFGCGSLVCGVLGWPFAVLFGCGYLVCGVLGWLFAVSWNQLSGKFHGRCRYANCTGR